MADESSRTDPTADADAIESPGDERTPASAEHRTDEATDAETDAGRPEVVVPRELYKTVTVFSTLFSVLLVVGGMIALDSATARATRSAGEVNLPVAFLGVAAIVLGAATYAFAARFRAAGMGNAKETDDER